MYVIPNSDHKKKKRVTREDTHIFQSSPVQIRNLDHVNLLLRYGCCPQTVWQILVDA